MDALVGAGAVADAWDIQAMRPLGRALGLSPDESRVFAESLLARNAVRIVPCNVGRTGLDEQPFASVMRWERCKEKDGKHPEGSK